MRLGVDIYALRFQRWGAFEHLDYAASQGLDVVHFSDLEPFERTDDGYLREVKAHADALGLGIEVGMLSICPTSTIFDPTRGTAVEQVRRMLHIAEALGSPILRCVLGSNADRHTETPLSEHMAATVATCQAVRGDCLDLGIKLAIENHAGDMLGRELAGLIERAGPEFVGACIDSGNPLWVAEDPMVTLEHLAPYVLTSHVRDTAVWPHRLGAAVQWVAMGDGNIGIRTWAERLRAMCPDVAFSLEIITGVPPRVLNYLEPTYWGAFPDARASEFARFERLVREGEPFLGPMLVAPRGELPQEYHAALRLQQRLDFERSVAYCREVLQIGEAHWR